VRGIVFAIAVEKDSKKGGRDFDEDMVAKQYDDS